MMSLIAWTAEKKEEEVTGNPEFGKRVRELREAKRKTNPKFSLRQFAEAVGISPTFLSKVETGEFAPPSPEKIKVMAQLLDVDADQLLAMAGKIDPVLPEIIRENPTAIADFLRTAREHSFSDADIAELTKKLVAKKKRQQESGA